MIARKPHSAMNGRVTNPIRRNQTMVHGLSRSHDVRRLQRGEPLDEVVADRDAQPDRSGTRRTDRSRTSGERGARRGRSTQRVHRRSAGTSTAGTARRWTTSEKYRLPAVAVAATSQASHDGRIGAIVVGNSRSRPIRPPASRAASEEHGARQGDDRQQREEQLHRQRRHGPFCRTASAGSIGIVIAPIVSAERVRRRRRTARRRRRALVPRRPLRACRVRGRATFPARCSSTSTSTSPTGRNRRRPAATHCPTPERVRRGDGRASASASRTRSSPTTIRAGVPPAGWSSCCAVLGVEAALLDGGLHGWPGPLETGPGTARPATRFTPRQWPADRFVAADQGRGVDRGGARRPCRRAVPR